MLNSIIQFSIKHKLMVGLMTLVLILWGGWSATRLPLDAVPDITNNQVQIITLTPTLAAQETEQLVTYPIEQSLANLPDLEEMRSISRFGLSVVTVVFAEHVDIYFARQLINERLKDAESKIPTGIGKPELAPVSSGLGEIYQYIIHPKKGAENKYSSMDLREMQDWIVARQLYGTPGVAEVISFGGLVKQYEVAVNPYRLRSLDVTIAELFTALEKNNENTGGAYIDKKPNAYFIRGIGLVHSMEDIKNIVIKKVNGIPVLVRDVAEVKFGNAARYGSVTYNGEKEVVGGIVMMLKGSNSAAVVERVKSKMANIKGALPDDVDVEVFLDRTDLVNRAVKTVETNLIEGALIVLFVLVVFMGNLRAGLIVASAIPLSMLFALGMMKVFGVSANLMSLGAIDFGLIVDGAVIIVEATLHHLATRNPGIRLTQDQMDKEVFISTSKIRNSAAFGEIIILIVYIPILTLVGIEGKMFRPMAQTVGFAIFGALLLSLTYIPMMSALFLPKQIKSQSYSDRMMDFLHRIYQPLLKGAIRFKLIIVTATVAVFIYTILVFSKMGGEFIPQLEEGDYAFHCILPQGTSLSQSVETSMQAIRIIKTFPDVKLVVGKTGSADIPTDPMPPEATDMIIVLKPKKEWTTTDDYNEMANKIMEKLEVIPGVFFEISQPIQMRFNELMTGVRQDVAIKIFGENIDTLAALGSRVAELIRGIDGISAPQVERTTGLPQITIQYDRARIAGYGLNIEDVNHTISTAFAGEAAGVVFENERKFDLVVRLDSAYRTSIEDVGNLFIAASGGIHIPLSQVAEISFKEGPAQISREDGKRILVVGFNITHRDVATIVEEVKEKLSQAAILPVAYYYTFGGTFENLQEAIARLKIAVPGALALIFILLYFTFGSIKESLLIFTAIPMSAIGGVFALLYRDMPFSISAGVGFIALFGVAVLNGIVLISTFNQLQKDGMENILERVLAGTKLRLRPVLMTATVASLGFIPMALSTGAGAEVQKPLATVVIGGLISATFLTLFVLPLLYMLFTHKRKLKSLAVVSGMLFCLFFSMDLNAQDTTTKRAGIEEVMQWTKNNLQYEINNQWIQKTNTRINSTMAFPKTGVFAENEDLRPSDTRGILKIGLSQSLAWPGWYKAQKNMVSEQLKYYQTNTSAIEAGIKRDVRVSYFQLWYLQDLKQLMNRLDTIYHSLVETTRLKVRAGESPGLDSLAAHARLQGLASTQQQLVHSIRIEQERLRLLSNSNLLVLPPDTPLEKLVVASNPGDGNPAHPLLQLQQQNIQIAKSGIVVAKQENKPDFSGRFYSQLLWAADNPFSGFSVSAAFPILGLNAHRNKVKLAEAEVEFQQAQSNFTNQGIISEREQAFQEMDKNRKGLSYYELTGLNQADQIIKAATLSYQSGEIGFSELSQFLTQAIEIRRNYLETLNKYNQSVIQYSYYINQ